MAKKIIQDIVTSVRRPNRPTVKPVSPQTTKTTPAKKAPAKIWTKLVFTVLLVVFLGILGVKIINNFSKIVVSIMPRTEKISVDETILAGLDKKISLETIQLEAEKQKTVSANGTKNVETKASGQIVVYNRFSSEPQTLVKNTRFETPDGKIYRTNKSISVPGMGSAETTVYADKAGEEYNLEFSDFTIPGLKGTPKYAKFYARSKTALTGGKIGTIAIISDTDLQNTKTELENLLSQELLGKARLKIPSEYILFDGALQIEYYDDSQKIQPNNGIDEAVISKKGRLVAFLISEKELSAYLIEKYRGDEMKDKAKILNMESLQFTAINKDYINGTMTFQISGEARLAWTLEEELLKEALVASSGDLSTALKEFPAIEKASVVFKPSWWPFFPDKISKISIEQNL